MDVNGLNYQRLFRVWFSQISVQREANDMKKKIFLRLESLKYILFQTTEIKTTHNSAETLLQK